MATNYDINYNDKRFTDVKAEEKAALNEVDVTYGNMISQSDKYYQDQIDAAQNWADKQSQLQQEQTDFAIEQIEQQKDQAQKDYTKEQSGAYVDWQKQSNQYGANAEQMASQGMTNTGFAESSQVSMYNTYQNRVATARESYNQIILDFNNSITEARLQNNSILAEIAYEAQKTRLELALQGFQYKNQLVTEQADRKLAVQQLYYNKWQDVLDQINTENALAEQVRQYNESLAEEKRQFNILHPTTSGSGGGKITGGSGGSGSGSGSGKKSSSGKIHGGSSGKWGSSTPTWDGSSLKKLGYGKISGNQLADLVLNGKVVVTQKGNTLIAKKSPAAKVAEKYLGLKKR